jgi:uncharacterized cupredoxin-like copper-binding protein
MNTKILYTSFLIALSGPAFAGGSHADGHGEMMKEMMIGMPGDASMVTRTIEVTMKETDDGDMIFEPSNLNINQGEVIRFTIKNAGELEHEFVLDTIKENATHKELMAKFPDMEHDDPNAVRLAAGEEGEIIWSFNNAGSLEFACLIPGHYEAGMHGGVVVEAVGGVEAVSGVEAVGGVEYTKGTVKKINTKSGKVTIIHEDLTNLGMPAMTMVFRVAEADMLEKMNVGDEIQFVADRVKGKLTVTHMK